MSLLYISSLCPAEEGGDERLWWAPGAHRVQGVAPAKSGCQVQPLPGTAPSGGVGEGWSCPACTLTGCTAGAARGGCTGGVGCEERSAVHPQSGGGMWEPHPHRPAARAPPAGQASRAGRQGGQALPSQGIVAASPCRCSLPHSCGHARPPALPDPHPVCRARHPGLSHPTASAGDGRPTIAHKGRMSPRSLPPARLRGNLPREGRAPPDAGWPMSFVLLTLACSERHAALGVPRDGQCHPPPCWARRRRRDVQPQGSG